MVASECVGCVHRWHDESNEKKIKELFSNFLTKHDISDQAKADVAALESECVALSVVDVCTHDIGGDWIAEHDGECGWL